MVRSVSPSRALGKPAHSEDVEMRKIGNYLWNLVIFLITPPLFAVMDLLGSVERHTGPAIRDYDRSVIQRMNVVLILYVHVFAMCFLCYIYKVTLYIPAALFILSVAILTPQVLLSYETWNWWKIASLQRQFRSLKQGDYEKGELAKLIENFLASELMTAEMSGFHTWNRFDHVFHLCRILGYWKRTRRELFVLCSINPFGIDD